VFLSPRRRRARWTHRLHSCDRFVVFDLLAHRSRASIASIFCHIEPNCYWRETTCTYQLVPAHSWDRR